jgi:hypothetical protein
MDPDRKGNSQGKGLPWSDRPPSRQAGPAFVVSYPLWGHPVAGYALGDHVRGIPLHWIGTRSFPCFGAECPLDHAVTAVRWYGYLAFLIPVERRPTLLGVSEHAFGALDALEGKLTGLRGAKLKLTRSTPGRRSRVLVELLSPEKASGLPPAFPVEPLLLHVWGLDPAEPAQSIEGPGGLIDVPTVNRLRLLVGDLFNGRSNAKGGA